MVGNEAMSKPSQGHVELTGSSQNAHLSNRDYEGLNTFVLFVDHVSAIEPWDKEHGASLATQPRPPATWQVCVDLCFKSSLSKVCALDWYFLNNNKHVVAKKVIPFSLAISWVCVNKLTHKTSEWLKSEKDEPFWATATGTNTRKQQQLRLSVDFLFSLTQRVEITGRIRVQRRPVDQTRSAVKTGLSVCLSELTLSCHHLIRVTGEEDTSFQRLLSLSLSFSRQFVFLCFSAWQRSDWKITLFWSLTWVGEGEKQKWRPYVMWSWIFSFDRSLLSRGFVITFRA